MAPKHDLTHIDPSKLDIKLDIRDLSREIIVTIRVLDDKLFTQLAGEAVDIYNEAKDELKKYKSQNFHP